MRQGQAEVHVLIKGVALSMALGALQCALQLACKDVLDHAVAAALGILPGLISLLADTALSFQLPVGWLHLHSVQLCLHSILGCGPVVLPIWQPQQVA